MKKKGDFKTNFKLEYSTYAVNKLVFKQWPCSKWTAPCRGLYKSGLKC